MQPLKNILALDAAGAACSSAVWSEGSVVARRFETMTRGQSERLVPMVQEVLETAGITYSQLDAVAATLGPGGFTGVRIGLAAARAFALALSRPMIGITNFEAVASAVLPDEAKERNLVVVLDAKRSDLYVQSFAVRAFDEAEEGAGAGVLPGRLEALTAPAAMMPEALGAFLPEGPLVLIGDAVEQAAEALAAVGRDFKRSRSPGLADAARVAVLAALGPLPDPDAPPPGPLYLRPPDVTLPGRRPFGARPGAVRSRPGS